MLQVIKQVLKLKCSATFAVPVTDEAVPNYSNVIKEPRDLGSISEKLGMSGEEGYTSLGKLCPYSGLLLASPKLYLIRPTFLCTCCLQAVHVSWSKQIYPLVHDVLQHPPVLQPRATRRVPAAIG